MQTATTTPKVSNGNFGRIARVGATTTLASTLINALIFALVSLPAESVPLAAVVIVTLMGGVAATVGYAILTRLLTAQNANRVMWAGIVLVLLGFAFNPFTIPNVSAMTIVTLQVMHLDAALPAWRLTR